MMRWFSKKARSIHAFALAALVIPFTYLVSSPCGAACGGCFLGGACILAYPIPLVAVIFAKLFKKKDLGRPCPVERNSSQVAIDQNLG